MTKIKDLWIPGENDEFIFSNGHPEDWERVQYYLAYFDIDTKKISFYDMKHIVNKFYDWIDGEI